ncbi:TIP39 protein, partial [Atractosteus spatula]|nr:TIP39 protein [Atractosteus spatula]
MKPVSPPRSAFLFLALVVSTLLPSGYTLPRLRSLRSTRLSPPRIGQDDSSRFRPQLEVLYPSVSLRDWSVQLMSSPGISDPQPKSLRLPERVWLPFGQSEMESLAQEEDLNKSWPLAWSQQMANEEKRNIVVADDAAFREKSKLLTAMERQKWLNSYMQKLLVVNSQ